MFRRNKIEAIAPTIALFFALLAVKYQLEPGNSALFVQVKLNLNDGARRDELSARVFFLDGRLQEIERT